MVTSWCYDNMVTPWYGGDSHLVQTVGDEREDKETAESSEEPDPPGYSRLPGLAGDDGGCHTVGLRTKLTGVFLSWKLNAKPGKPDVSRQPGMGVL